MKWTRCDVVCHLRDVLSCFEFHPRKLVDRIVVSYCIWMYRSVNVEEVLILFLNMAARW